MTYASARRPIRLTFRQRLVLRAPPILFLLHCVMNILSCLRCQLPDKYPLSWPVPCLSTPQNALWYTFKCTCLSYFVETFSASLEMRSGLADAGMTIVEYAFAFAETTNMTPAPEVLIAALLSVIGTLLTTHLVALFNWHRYRVCSLVSSADIVTSFDVARIYLVELLHLHHRQRSIPAASQHPYSLSDSVYIDAHASTDVFIHITPCHDVYRSTRSENLDHGRWCRCSWLK